MLEVSNLKKLQDNQEQGAWLNVIDPTTGEESGARMLIAGASSKAFSKYLRAMATSGALDIDKDDVEKVDELQRDAVATLVLDWDGFTNNGESWDYSRDNVVILFSFSPHIQAQVDRFAAELSNYIEKKSKD